MKVHNINFFLWSRACASPWGSYTLNQAPMVVMGKAEGGAEARGLEGERQRRQWKRLSQMVRRSCRKGGWLGNRRFNAIPEDEIALKTTQRNKQRTKDTPPGRWKRSDPSQGEEEEGGESTSPL